MESLDHSKQRIASIDILRGLVMLLMALDHVRDFFHPAAMTDDPLNLETTTPALFFTRWITHLCAPVFVFLSGCSCYLAGIQKTPKQLSKFLITRGVWLIIIEVTVITFGWTFNPHYHFLIIQVIWAIGFSMIILGLLVLTSYRSIVIIGVLVFIGHNLLDYVSPPSNYTSRLVLNLLLVTTERVFPITDQHHLFIIYAALPWTSIMLLGYGYGIIFTPRYDYKKRRRTLVLSGLAALALFFILRSINGYGDPQTWNLQKSFLLTFLDFINVTKYPPSLLYSLITLGLSMILLAIIETWKNRLSKIVEAYGRVPFLYYVLHVYLIHSLTVVVFYLEGYGNKDIVNPNIIFLFRPAAFGYPLLVVYLIWFLVITILYFPCRWFSEYRKTHHQWWLSYL